MLNGTDPNRILPLLPFKKENMRDTGTEDPSTL